MPRFPYRDRRTSAGSIRLMTALVVALAAAMLFAVVVRVERWRDSRSDALLLPAASAATFERGGATGFTAHVFARASDCGSNLTLLDLLAVGDRSSRVPLAAIHVVGDEADVESVEAWTEAKRPGIAVTRATRRQRALLSALGARRTPFILVIDADGVIRLAAHSPADIDALLGLKRVLATLQGTGSRDPLLMLP